MSLPTIVDYQRCIEHFERVSKKYRNMMKRKDPSYNPSTYRNCLSYFASRIRYYRKRIAHLERSSY